MVRRLAAALEGKTPLPARWTVDAVTFAPGQAVVPVEAQAVEEDLATVLAAHPGARILLVGAGDTNAATPEALQLAESRAETLKYDLVSRGIAPDRIGVTTGVDGARAALTDRRVELVLVAR